MFIEKAEIVKQAPEGEEIRESVKSSTLNKPKKRYEQLLKMLGNKLNLSNWSAYK